MVFGKGVAAALKVLILSANEFVCDWMLIAELRFCSIPTIQFCLLLRALDKIVEFNFNSHATTSLSIRFIDYPLVTGLIAHDRLRLANPHLLLFNLTQSNS